MRALSRVVRCVLVAGLVATGLVVVTAVPAAAMVGPNILNAGESAQLMASKSGNYWLNVNGDSMTLYQQIGNGSRATWGTRPRTLTLTGGRLVMQRDGNLVLRDKAGHPVWTSRTGGTGSHNHLILTDSGNLAVYTSTGKRVWQSGSGPTMMKTGSTLFAGQYLRSRYDDTTPWVRLIMGRDGNLLLTYGSQVRWTSGTHVAGSRLVGLPDGNWAIYTPQNRPIWSTRTSVHVKTILAVSPAGLAADIQVTRDGDVLFERTV